MDLNYYYYLEDTNEENYPLSRTVSSMCSDNNNAKPEILDPIDVTNELDDEEITSKDHTEENEAKAKRERTRVHRLMMEKKRRHTINEKVETLLAMTPYPKKTTFETKIENITKYIRGLRVQRDRVLSAKCQTYISSFYGDESPYFLYENPWICYIVPRQNMHVPPQHQQAPDAGPSNQAQPPMKP